MNNNGKTFGYGLSKLRLLLSRQKLLNMTRSTTILSINVNKLLFQKTILSRNSADSLDRAYPTLYRYNQHRKGRTHGNKGIRHTLLVKLDTYFNSILGEKKRYQFYRNMTTTNQDGYRITSRGCCFKTVNYFTSNLFAFILIL